MLEVIKMWFPLESAGRSFGCKRTSLIEAARRRFLENHRGCGIVGKRDFSRKWEWCSFFEYIRQDGARCIFSLLWSGCPIRNWWHTTSLWNIGYDCVLLPASHISRREYAAAWGRVVWLWLRQSPGTGKTGPRRSIWYVCLFSFSAC